MSARRFAPARLAAVSLLAALALSAPRAAVAQNGDASSCYYLDFNGNRIGPYPASNLSYAYSVMTGYGYTFTGWYNKCTGECGGDGCPQAGDDGSGCYYLNFNGKKFGPFHAASLGAVYQSMAAKGYAMTGWYNSCNNQCGGDGCTPAITNGGLCYFLDFSGQRIGPYASSSLGTVYAQMAGYGYTMTGWVNSCTGECGGNGCP
jgi:hypothetical protein